MCVTVENPISIAFICVWIAGLARELFKTAKQNDRIVCRLAGQRDLEILNVLAESRIAVVSEASVELLFKVSRPWCWVVAMPCVGLAAYQFEQREVISGSSYLFLAGPLLAILRLLKKRIVVDCTPDTVRCVSMVTLASYVITSRTCHAVQLEFSLVECSREGPSTDLIARCSDGCLEILSANPIWFPLPTKQMQEPVALALNAFVQARQKEGL